MTKTTPRSRFLAAMQPGKRFFYVSHWAPEGISRTVVAVKGRCLILSSPKGDMHLDFPRPLEVTEPAEGVFHVKPDGSGHVFIYIPAPDFTEQQL